MPTFAAYSTSRNETDGSDTSASRGTAITANASSDTKGTYTQLIASTPFDAAWVWVLPQDSDDSTDMLLDISVGAAASEQVVLSNLLITSHGQASIVHGAQYMFPIEIAAGSRVSARVQGSLGSDVLYLSVVLFGRGYASAETLSIVDTWGDDTTNSDGTSIDPGGTANTKGSYVQFVASTTRPIRFLIIAIGNQLNSVRSSCNWLLDVAVGAAASEQIILSNYPVNCSASDDIVLPQTSQLIPVDIPAGSRIAVRSQCSITNATDRIFDVVLYGVG